jgi:2-oxo-4-hydroxy-4-carboxy--5-ureidoimidazoline (OHCU) decarboxylase
VTDPVVADLAPLFEGASAFLARLAAADLPADDPDRLFATARAIAHAMPEPDQIELIDAHPRLGAPPESVSALSFAEQGYDRGPVTDLAAEFERLNDAYEATFGFRYCVFVAGRSRAALLPGFEAALASGDREAERRRAIDAVIDIAADRHARLTAHAKETPR